MRLRHRKDENHDEIVDALERAGWSVLDLHNVGGGCPDIALGKHGRTLLGEIKVDDPKDKRRSKLRDSQERFKLHWRGGLVLVFTSPLQAIEHAESELRRR